MSSIDILLLSSELIFFENIYFKYILKGLFPLYDMLTHGEPVISVSERKDFKKASWHNVVKYMKSYRIVEKYL